jgi:subtilisin family serine protease
VTAYLTTDSPVLRGVTGAGVRIAVIDSGIARRHPHVGPVHRGISLVGDDPDDWIDTIGHGTAVAAAIQEKAPGAELIPIRVLDRGRHGPLATSARVLSRAIQWAIDDAAHIVNLSLGTTNAAHVPLFEDVLRQAHDRGVLVVSAARHLDTSWYPGAMTGAVGVITDVNAPRNGMRGHGDGTATIFEASPYPRPIEGVPVERNLAGVSFAVANVTGLLALSLEAGAPRTSAAALWHWDRTVRRIGMRAPP